MPTAGRSMTLRDRSRTSTAKARTVARRKARSLRHALALWLEQGA